MMPAAARSAVANVLVATELADEGLDLLRRADGIALDSVPPLVPAVREVLEWAHALIARDDLPIDDALLNDAPHLKVIGRVGAGLTGIDIEAATKRGIVVMNTPGTNAIAVAEHTMALMLALSRKLIPAHNTLNNGAWRAERRAFVGTQLAGKTLGIVGLGRVGQIVAQRGLAFGMTVVANDPYLHEDQVGDDRIRLVGLSELLRQSDFITIHVADTRETHGLFDAEALQRVRHGARLINVSQGNVLDEQALAQALREGRLGGVALDVYADEAGYHSPLLGLDNVIHTPHIGDNTQETARDVSIQIVEQVLDALRGLNYRNVVNMPFAPDANFEELRPYLLLGERIGILQQALARSPIRRVAVEYRGEELSGLVKPLTVALLKGLLAPALGEKVNYINAPVLAGERGLQIMQTKGLKTGNYQKLISCEVTWEGGGTLVIAGTLFDRNEPRIVQIDDYRVDVVPEGHLLIMGSYDRPGVIGRVGMLMADNNINIASWRTGRKAPGGHTLTVLRLDDALPDDVLDEIRRQDFVRHATCVAL